MSVSNNARPLPKNKAAKAEYDRLTTSLCWVRMDNIRCENDSAAPAGHNETRVLSLISFAIFENAMVKILQLGTRTPQRCGRSSTGSTQRH